MTAPVGPRVGWEFLKYTVRFTRLFVDFCGLSVGLKKRPQFPIPRLSAMMPLLAYVIFALLSYDIFAFGISAFSSHQRRAIPFTEGDMPLQPHLYHRALPLSRLPLQLRHLASGRFP
jgi:hypothetical protein